MDTRQQAEAVRAAIRQIADDEGISHAAAAERLRTRFRQQSGTTAPDQLAARGLQWLAEQRAEQERRDMERFQRQAPAAAPRPRVDRVPREYAAGLPIRVTVAQVRVLDLVALGASAVEVARIEAITPSTVYNTLSLLYGRVCVGDLRALAQWWREMCEEIGRPFDPACDEALRKHRATHLTPATALELSDAQWTLLHLWAGRNLTVPQIALRLQLSERTVERRIQALYRAMGVRSRAGAAYRYDLDRQEKEAARGQ